MVDLSIAMLVYQRVNHLTASSNAQIMAGMFPQRSSFSQRSENLLQVLGANTKLFLEMDHGQTWMTIWMIWDYSGIILGLYIGIILELCG